MNISQAKDYFHQQLASVFDEGEENEIFSRVVEHLTALSKLEIRFNQRIDINETEFVNIVDQLHTNKPIQYTLGYEWFYNLKLKVNEHVLIPRPETEELVRWILDFLKEENLNKPVLIDLGTGSGCIPIILKKQYPLAQVNALDISEKAIELAKENAFDHAAEIQFIVDDILQPKQTYDYTFDVIISNPPYITIDEKEEMHDRVLSFEPSLALFVTNNDPLQFYKSILLFAKQYLSPNGAIFLELNRDYGEATESLFQQAGFATSLRKDMYGNTRMLMARPQIKKPTIPV